MLKYCKMGRIRRLTDLLCTHNKEPSLELSLHLLVLRMYIDNFCANWFIGLQFTRNRESNTEYGLHWVHRNSSICFVNNRLCRPQLQTATITEIKRKLIQHKTNLSLSWLNQFSTCSTFQECNTVKNLHDNCFMF